jgi:hypothetical protein
MDGHEFWTRVHADKRLEWLGCVRAGRIDPSTIAKSVPLVLTEDTVFVKGPGHIFSVSVTGILESDWTTILAVLVGERPPQVLSHWCRIVGYFSKETHWNRSKLQEMSDRRNGTDFLFSGKSVPKRKVV